MTGQPPRRRLCLAADLERYHTLDAGDQDSAQKAVTKVLEQAAAGTLALHGEWDAQPLGDGEVALLPVDLDETVFLRSFIRRLHEVLHEHNRRRLPRLRLRVALHYGAVRLTETGFPGPGMVTVRRLCDATEVKNLFAADEDAPFVLVLSPSLYEDVVDDDSIDVPRRAFQRVRVESPQQDFFTDARVFLPGSPVNEPAGRREAMPPAPTPPTPGRGGSHGPGSIHLENIHAQEVNAAGGSIYNDGSGRRNDHDDKGGRRDGRRG